MNVSTQDLAETLAVSEESTTDDVYLEVVSKRSKRKGKSSALTGISSIVDDQDSTRTMTIDHVVRAESMQFQLYRYLYLPSRGPVRIMDQADRETWIGQMEKQCDFSVIDANFSSFLSTHKSAVISHFSRIPHTLPTKDSFTLAYTHDKLVYGATSEVSVCLDQKAQLWKNLNLRLCNDGFLYNDRTKLHLHNNSTYDQHRSTNWVLLGRSEVNKISTVVALAMEMLGGHPGCKVYYHEGEQRMDMKFSDHKKLLRVNVSFEPGYALNDFDDDADWY